MSDDREWPRPRRRLQLSRETLRDLTPGAADAAEVAGGATINNANCLKARQEFMRRTTAIPGPESLFEEHRTTAVLVGPGGIKPGRYVVEQTKTTDFEVLENGEVIIRSTVVRDAEPEQR